jgi:colicin import membrane protein
MGFAQRTLKFGGGLVLGAAVGTAVSVLLAPQSGPELQGTISDRLEEAERAGEEAEILEQERLKREFRAAVNDPTALTGKFAERGGQPQVEDERAKALKEAAKAEEAAKKARERAAKEQAEADQARQRAAKEQEDADRAKQQAAQAQEDAAKARQEAAKPA